MAAPEVSEIAQRHTSIPERRRSTLLYVIVAIVSLIGLADAIYLTIEHLAGRSVQCTVVAGCSEVLGSAYATIGGIPLAGIGALAYFTVFSCATLALFEYRSAQTLLSCGLDVFGALVAVRAASSCTPSALICLLSQP